MHNGRILGQEKDEDTCPDPNDSPVREWKSSHILGELMSVERDDGVIVSRVHACAELILPFRGGTVVHPGRQRPAGSFRPPNMTVDPSHPFPRDGLPYPYPPTGPDHLPPSPSKEAQLPANHAAEANIGPLVAVLLHEATKGQDSGIPAGVEGVKEPIRGPSDVGGAEAMEASSAEYRPRVGGKGEAGGGIEFVEGVHGSSGGTGSVEAGGGTSEEGDVGEVHQSWVGEEDGGLEDAADAGSGLRLFVGRRDVLYRSYWWGDILS
mmetsp:Transcript_39045/g.90876  ORF Transcript_39045/g.90876 Transcript_39045/m.90876 type:complete len:265 (-) Transcript_39045:2006-2800(-)